MRRRAITVVALASVATLACGSSESEVEKSVRKAASYRHKVERVDCSETGRNRHTCNVKFESGGCQEWVVATSGDRAEGGYFETGRNC